MKLSKSTDSRTSLSIMLRVWAATVVGSGVFIHSLRPVTDDESAETPAKVLLARVGGASNVCYEADQIFKRFGISEDKFLDPPELKDYPAIASLGMVHRIEPHEPPHISNRIGTHQNCYFLDITSTNSVGNYPNTIHGIEIVPGRIFVHR